MTQEEFYALRRGDRVQVRQSGKTYRVVFAETPEERTERMREYNARMEQFGSPKRATEDDPRHICFVQVRNGVAYGAVRHLRMESIDRYVGM
jgi:hypothetical protein